MGLKNRIKKRIISNDDFYYDEKNIFLILTIFLVMLDIFMVITLLTPKIMLMNGKEEIKDIITINYKEKFIFPRYQAVYQKYDITSHVKVFGKVNSDKIGDYKISYQVPDGLFHKNRVITVRVRDLSAPSIKLTGKTNVTVCPNKEYKEQGYRAYDNLDGNITEKVKVKRQHDKVLYSVVDKAGNKKEAVRSLVYQDKTPPSIKLNGSSYESVYLNEKFRDLGVVAEDNCDGNISKKVKVEGKVDTSKCGSYELTYSVMDNNNNKSKRKRLVTVVEEGQNGSIYLTFDDGPKAGTTDVILDILKEEGVKATFFVTDRGPDELIVREHAEGHTVGLHTASHDYSYVYSSVEAYYQDLLEVRARVKRLIGIDATIIRFPGGASNTISRKYSKGIMTTLTQDVLAKGFRYYDWNLASGDAGECYTAEEVYQQVVSNLSKERVNIVLMHDIKPYTRDALKNIIRYAKENGYHFDKITEKTEIMSQHVNN